MVQVPGIVTVCVDVSNIEATKKEVEKLHPIHFLVNNAGVTELQPFLEVTPEAYDKYVCCETEMWCEQHNHLLS